MTADDEEKPYFDFNRATRLCDELETTQLVI